MYTNPTLKPHLPNLLEILPEDRVVTGEKTDRFSKDFYWYSPVLKELLEDKRADVALLVTSKEELKSVVSLLLQTRHSL